MTTSSDEEKIKAVEKTLGEPVFCEFDEKTWKIRTKLIMASVVSISVVLGNLHIEPGSSILGLKFSGISDGIVRNTLFILNIYFLLHFIWCSLDNFLEWRLRLTGTRVSFVTAGTFASSEGDYPNDPRQSTLYNWWRSQIRRIEKISIGLEPIEKSIKEWEEKINKIELKEKNSLNISNACSSLSQTRNEITKLTQAIDKNKEMIASNRVPVSLSRFDNWFQLFLRSQNLRWFLIEFILPLILSGYSVLLLYSSGIFTMP